MSTHSEAVRLNLEYYLKQAKALLKAAKTGDGSALQRLIRYAYARNGAPALHDAQLTIAREHGFSSWPRFKAFIVESSLDFQGIVTAFIDAALWDSTRAEQILSAHPEAARAGLYTALVMGDVETAAQALREIPEIVSTKGGPYQWEPLLYVCFSRFASRESSRASGLVETAQTLLRHGANPNAFHTANEWPDSPLPCLYAAAGLNNNPALTRALLEAGANPDDSESLYHSTEHADLACMRLLLEHGASPMAVNALKHMLDREDIEGVQLLLQAGADPNQVNGRGETALQWAVWRGRSARAVAMLLDNDAAIDAKRNDGRTAYAMAVQSGQTELAALLEARGAKTDLSPLDRFSQAAATAGAQEWDRLLSKAPEIALPEAERLLPDLTISHRTSAVRALLATGMPVDARGELGGTALHWACWKGYADLVEVLLRQGASLTAEDHQFHGTPAGWFAHGLATCSEHLGDPPVARLLLAAGATIPSRDIPTGNDEVDAVLREHGLID